MTTYHLCTDSPEPFYSQLVNQVRRRIVSGQLRGGAVMPSVRDLAIELRVTPMTISRAFGILHGQGLLVRRRGMNMMVSDGASTASSADDRASLLRPLLERAAAEARELQVPVPELIALLQTVAAAGEPHHGR